ncbi:hypothetical protein ACE1ET_09530 [Saccharicrinis sp. FJH62]|uniref:hypothetical protein n=1 Tax=Saccharicrinis sp. FJH62 TaxID=3344657 RepID=UPI0035D4341A
MEQANNAKKNHEKYLAYRYTIKAIALNYHDYKIEDYEFAGALRIMPQQGISDLEDTITINIEPIFDLGEPLSGTYKARFILRDNAWNAIQKFQFNIDKITNYNLNIPIKLKEEGLFYIGYKLITPDGDSLPEAPYTFLAVKNLNQLYANIETQINRIQLNDADAQYKTVIESLSYMQHSLEKEQNGYEGFARNFPAIARMQFVWDNRAFKQDYMGKINYPNDINLIRKYLSLLENNAKLYTLTGDLKQSVTIDNIDNYYRIYIPEKYHPEKKYPLVAVFPMGMEVDAFFNNQEFLKNKADELNWIILCVGNFRNSEDRDLQLFTSIDRIKKLYSINDREIFLTGGGNSGDLVWQTGLKYHKFFRAIAPIGGTALWLSKDEINNNTELPVLLVTGSNEHQDILNKIITTKDIAENVFEDFNFMKFENADHISIWDSALPKIVDFFESVKNK